MRKPVAIQRARKAWNTADIVEFSILFIHTLSIWRDISLSMIVFVFWYIWRGIVLSVFFYHLIFLDFASHLSLSRLGCIRHTLFSTWFYCFFTSFASCFRLSTIQFLFRASISTQRTCLWLTGFRGFSPITTMLVKPGRWDGWLKNKVEPRRVKFSKKNCLCGKIFMFFFKG